jgi:hypothetical protein
MFAPWFEVSRGIGIFFWGVALGELFDLVELMAPEAFEGLRPLVERTDGVGVGSVKHVAAVAADVHQANVFENAEVLGDRGLLEAQAIDDFVDGTFLKGEEVQDVAAAGFGDGVEGVGGCCGAWHGFNIFPYGNMSRGKFGRRQKIRKGEEGSILAIAARLGRAEGWDSSLRSG